MALGSRKIGADFIIGVYASVVNHDAFAAVTAAAALGALLGALALYRLPTLPAPGWLWAALPGLLALFAARRAARGAGVALVGGGAAVLGFCWALLQSTPPLPAALEDVELIAEGWIASLPARRGRALRFRFRVAELRYADDAAAPPALRGDLRLSWYRPAPPLAVGDRWRLRVRLKRPGGYRNPGAFDYARWLYAERYAATGYVRRADPDTAPDDVRRGASAGAVAEPLRRGQRFAVDRLRARLAARIDAALSGRAEAALLRALTVGDRRAVSDAQRQVLRRTGTGHLLAISGLHVGLVAALAFALTRRLWRLLPAPLLHRRAPPAPLAAALAAAPCAAGYALLAGLTLPTQRALAMLAVALLALVWLRPLRPGRALALALLAVLVVDARAPLSGGFWLSFAAVATLLYALVGRGGAWRRHRNSLRLWLRLQCALLLALTPLTLILFQSVTPLSPLANLIAVPWVGSAVIPPALCGVAAELFGLDALAALSWRLAALTLAWVWGFLEWLAAFPIARLTVPAPPLWTLLLALPGIALLLAPPGWPGRWLGLLLCWPLLAAPRPAAVTTLAVLDVGRGVAAVLHVDGYTLVYDTGPRVGVDPARSALLPYLRRHGVDRVDLLLISDARHGGGVRGLLETLPVAATLTTTVTPPPIAAAGRCSPRRWRGARMRLRLLDAASCTLRVEAAGRRLLLAPSLTPDAARRLLAADAAALRADVLLAPSRWPLPARFVAAVGADHVLLSLAYNDRYGHPRPQTLAAYRAARVWTTAEAGALRVELRADRPPRPAGFAAATRRHWHAR